MTKKESDKIVLKVEGREIVGKGVKKLRRQNLLPGNIYGEGFKSTAIQIDAHEFSLAHRAAGETQVIHLMLGSDDIPTMIHQVQYHPVTDKTLHVDLRKVDLNKKIQTEVPLKQVGESPAIEGKKGDLIADRETIMVEALPDNVPLEIEVDISVLASPGDEIKVKDLKQTGDFTIISEPDKTILRIIEHKEEELEAQIPEEEVPAEGEASGETETEAPAEGEEKADESGDATADKNPDEKKGPSDEKQTESS